MVELEGHGVSSARGIELAYSVLGEGASVLLIHETATSSRAWEPVAHAVADGARAIRYDRRGWSDAATPDGYRRTTIAEQSEDAAALLEADAGGPAVAAGAGIGAVIALDLLLRRSELVSGAVLVEPPLLALLPEATEILSSDLSALEAEAGRGRDALADLYLSGGLGALGAGASRLPPELTAPGRERTGSVVAELGAVPSWGMPLAHLRGATGCSRIVVSPESPRLLSAAAEALAVRLAGSELLRVGTGHGPAHVEDPAGVAALAVELAAAES